MRTLNSEEVRCASTSAFPPRDSRFFVSSWVLMVFAGMTAKDLGIRPFGYVTSMIATIGLWLVVTPAIGAIALRRPWEWVAVVAARRPWTEHLQRHERVPGSCARTDSARAASPPSADPTEGSSR